METKLGTVKLWGRDSTMPGIPDANVSGQMIAEKHALLFRAAHSDFTLAIPWEQIKSCYVDWQDAKDLGSWATQAAVLFLVRAKEYFVILTYYSAEHDMDITIMLFIGNTLNNTPFRSAEKDAAKLAKAIWTIRSDHVNEDRRRSSIVYR